MCLYTSAVGLENCYIGGVNTMIFYARFNWGGGWRGHIDPALIVSSDSLVSYSFYTSCFFMCFPFSSSSSSSFIFFFLFSSYSFFSLIWPAVFLSFSVLSRPLSSPARHQLEATSLTFHNLETFEKYIAHTRCRHKDEWNASLALRPVRIPLFFSKLLQSLYHWKVKAFSSFFSVFFLPSFSSW